MNIEMNDIVVVLEGGLVTFVGVKDPELRKSLGHVVVVDYDTDGVEDSELTLVTDNDGVETDAIVHIEPVAIPLINIEL